MELNGKFEICVYEGIFRKYILFKKKSLDLKMGYAKTNLLFNSISMNFLK